MVAPPRSALAGAVEQLLVESSPRFLVDHARRSLELACLIATAEGLVVDAEVLHAGVLLHDLGLTTRFHSSEVRFEVAGADAARELVLGSGMAPARAATVWDVVALHGTPGIAERKGPEVAVAAEAIGADVTGSGLERLDPAQVARVMATRPGFAGRFIDAVVADLRDKPHVASSTWMAGIAAHHLPRFRPPSIEHLALAHPFERMTVEVPR